MTKLEEKLIDELVDLYSNIANELLSAPNAFARELEFKYQKQVLKAKLIDKFIKLLIVDRNELYNKLKIRTYNYPVSLNDNIDWLVAYETGILCRKIVEKHTLEDGLGGMPMEDIIEYEIKHSFINSLEELNF